jgi:hypothetical protein
MQQSSGLLLAAGSTAATPSPLFSNDRRGDCHVALRLAMTNVSWLCLKSDKFSERQLDIIPFLDTLSYLCYNKEKTVRGGYV